MDDKKDKEFPTLPSISGDYYKRLYEEQLKADWFHTDRLEQERTEALVAALPQELIEAREEIAELRKQLKASFFEKLNRLFDGCDCCHDD